MPQTFDFRWETSSDEIYREEALREEAIRQLQRDERDQSHVRRPMMVNATSPEMDAVWGVVA